MSAIQACLAGRGGFVLVSGEAGMGKSALVRAALANGRSLPAQVASAPGDRLDEAIRAFKMTGAPAAAILEDLQWTDRGTLEVLPALAADAADAGFLVIATYRSDELSRHHPLRRMRVRLRRAGRLPDIALGPLSASQTPQLIAAALGGSQRTGAPLLFMSGRGLGGRPLVAEELAAALRTAERLESAGDELDLVGGDEPTLPESARDTVRLRLESLSAAASACLEIAAVSGDGFELALLAELGAEPCIGEPVESQFLAETGPGIAA